MELGDILVLVIVAGICLWFIRVISLGPPPVRWTQSWLRVLWRLVTYRKSN